ncbi:MAG TPA: hypothetical protein DEQ30_07030 [Porphyromonadaceae bacterium]|nr:hypothetical protein [Porphyromonadaceae bacterium]
MGSLLLVAGLSVVLFARKPLTPQEELILRNAEAIAQNEGTPVGSCVRNSGPNGEYGLKMFCDSKTNTDMIYPCPTAPTYGYSLENNKDRCTK